MGRAGKVFGACALAFAFLIPAGPAHASNANPNGKSGAGYWTVSGDGTVVPFGDAKDLGLLPRRPNGRIVGIAAQPGGQGYLLAGSDGGVFTRGTARFMGSMGGRHLNRPIVGIAYTATGNGYYLVASDGGVFTFGDAHFYGSTGSLPLRAPIVGIADTPSGHGYWLVAADGGVFRFGDAHFYGSAVPLHPRSGVVAMAVTHSGLGYWLLGADGGVFTFGDAHFYGSANGLFGPAVAIMASPRGQGYVVISRDGGALAFGDAVACGSFGFIPDGGIPVPLARAAFGGFGDVVGAAVPFDASTLSTFLAASCDGVSNAFHPATPWHVDIILTNEQDFGYPYCQVGLLRSTLSGGSSPLLSVVTGEGGAHMEVRSTQMAGNSNVRISAEPNCVAIARTGAGGTRSLPFTTDKGGDTLPFTKGSNITVDVSAVQACQVEIFADSDGHFVDGHFGSHAHLTIPAGTYFMRSDPDCPATVS